MCPDEQSGREMGLAELTATVTEKESVDLMALELCAMGGIEIAYQWRPGNGGFGTRMLLAIPNSGPALEWKRVFWRLRSPGNPVAGRGDTIDPGTLTPEGFGKLIVREGGIGRHAARQEREAVACYDLAQAAAVKEAVDAWAVELARTGAKEVLEELRGPGPDGYALNYGRDRMDEAPYVDLHDLSLRASKCERLDPSARQAAARVMEKVDALVVASWGGSSLPRFQAHASGVYVTFPDGDAEPRRGPKGKRLWEGCEWYTPLPSERFFGRLAWCKDGATPGNGKVENWFELMDAWFDDTARGPEGCNKYAP
jgi:clostripain